MFRYFIYLAYDGTNYHGWQIQPNGSSVQETLMKALHTFLRDDAIEVVGAGRTDAGVHARLMVAHFDVEWMLEEDTVTDKLNRLLPPDISVYRVRRVNQDAHARLTRRIVPINIMSPHRRTRSIGLIAGDCSSRWILRR